MNKYGQMAKKHWAENLPTRYQELSNPESFFTDLGEVAAQQIQELEMTLAGPDLPAEEYLAKLGRLKAAHAQAEEMVLADTVWLDPEVDAEQAFLDWAATAPWSQTQIGNWADQTQLEDADPEAESTQQTVDEMVDLYGLPKTFFQELLATPSPWGYVFSHEEQIRNAIRAVWGRETADQ
jgi:hypothetical protein